MPARTILVGLSILMITRAAPPGQDATFCSSLQRIADAAPEKWKSYDAGPTMIGGGAIALPGARPKA